LFAPAGQPPHKPEAHPSSIAHRVALVKAALVDVGEPAFELSRVDLDRTGPHYTVDALNILREKYPGAELWFLIGGDSLNELPKWRAPHRIIELARLGVLPRPGYRPDLDAIAARLVSCSNEFPTQVELPERIDWLTGPAPDISSSALRKRSQHRLPLRFLVPAAVETYVQTHQLYGLGVES
jgi:nicotinate-nucleotide adenylyltransferase